MAQHLYEKHFASHIYDSNRKKQTVDALINGPDGKNCWIPALSNEWGRLAQGNANGVIATDTIEFIPFSDIPQNKKVTYASFACDHRPLKSEPWQMWCVVGGDKLPFLEDSVLKTCVKFKDDSFN